MPFRLPMIQYSMEASSRSGSAVHDNLQIGFADCIGIHYLLHFAMAALVTALTVMLRGSGLSMTFGVICSTGATMLLYRLTNILLQKCGVSKAFDIGEYALENCIKAVTPGLHGGDFMRVLAVGIGFILVSTLVAVLVMRKRDIR